MRLMSFSMTTKAYESCEKTVTRRLGWKNLRPGTKVMGALKCMGLKKGERVQKLHPLVVISNTTEPLNEIIYNPVRESGVPEVVLEGFPKFDGHEELFVEMFAEHNDITPDEPVQRIQFGHLYMHPAAGRVVA